MANLISEQDLTHLKNTILANYGSPLEYSRDCQALALTIQKKTGKIIGESTIKRLFGFATAHYLPSNITLDTLSEYAYGKPWNNYKIKQKKQKSEEDTRYKEISDYTFVSIKNRAGVAFNKIPLRLCAKQHIIQFLKSDKTATALIAPGGYGKSTILAKVYEHLWFTTSSPDYVLFLSASSLNNLLMHKNFSLENWLLSQIGIVEGGSFTSYLNKREKGKFVLIIDALDEVAIDIENLERLFNQITDLAGYASQSKCFKLILSMRISTWVRFSDSLVNAPELQKIWYGVQFNTGQNHIANIPPLSQDEINDTLLAFLPNAKDFIAKINTELYQLLSYPYLLQLYIQIIIQKPKYNINDRADIVLHFINQKIYSGLYQDEKKQIINELLLHTDYGKKGQLVEKRLLNELLNKRQKAYRELLSYGILMEERIPNKFKLNTVYIKFGHGNLLEILLAIYLLEEYDNQPNNTLLEKINQFLNPEIGIEVLRWIIIFACKAENISFLKNYMNAELKSKDSENWYFSEQTKQRMCLEITFFMRSSEKLRKTLIPYYAKNSISREIFFEVAFDMDAFEYYWDYALEEYLKYAHSIENKCFAYSLLYYIAFLKTIVKNKIITTNCY